MLELYTQYHHTNVTYRTTMHITSCKSILTTKKYKEYKHSPYDLIELILWQLRTFIWLFHCVLFLSNSCAYSWIFCRRTACRSFAIIKTWLCGITRCHRKRGMQIEKKEGNKERKKERERQTDRQTDRQTERQTDRMTIMYIKRGRI